MSNQQTPPTNTSQPRFSRAEAEAVANNWVQGNIISPSERIKRFAGEVEAALEKAYEKGGYPVVRQVRQYMEEKGYADGVSLEADIDPALIERMQQEYECAAVCWDDRWGVDQDCLVTCLQEANPYRPPEERADVPDSPINGRDPLFQLDMGVKQYR